MDVPYFLDDMESKVASAMEGADQKAVESQMYKDVMKSIAVSDCHVHKILQQHHHHFH